MKQPMKYTLKYVIFSLARKNKNFIYVSENWGKLRKQSFEKVKKPSLTGTVFNSDTSVFDQFNIISYIFFIIIFS